VDFGGFDEVDFANGGDVWKMVIWSDSADTDGLHHFFF
jgi:hypothetical protein